MILTHLIAFGFLGGGGIPRQNVKRKRGKYEIEINGQRFIASSIPALEAMVAQWRKANPANDKPTLVTAKPKPRKEVVPHTRAIDALPPGRDTATPRVPERAPGAVAVQLGPTQSELALGQQAAVAHAALAELAARAQIEALEHQLAEEAARRQAEEDDDVEAIMAILQAVA